MAVLPETAETPTTSCSSVSHRDAVLASLMQLRQRIEAVVADVAGGRCTLADVFERSVTDEPCRVVYLVKIAEAVPGVGKVRARRVLAEHGCAERTRVGEVSTDVRARLVAALG